MSDLLLLAWAACLLLWAISTLVVVVHAFRSSALSGALALVFWPYTVYYLVARLRHPRKGWIVGAYVLGFAGNVAMYAASQP